MRLDHTFAIDVFHSLAICITEEYLEEDEWGKTRTSESGCKNKMKHLETVYYVIYVYVLECLKNISQSW